MHVLINLYVFISFFLYFLFVCLFLHSMLRCSLCPVYLSHSLFAFSNVCQSWFDISNFIFVLYRKLFFVFLFIWQTQVSNEFAERRSKKVAKLHFACQIRGPHCLYSKACFTMRTRNPKTWIHLMFLDFQVRHYVSMAK